jgi:hypothetical protein
MLNVECWMLNGESNEAMAIILIPEMNDDDE